MIQKFQQLNKNITKTSILSVFPSFDEACGTKILNVYL